MARILRLLAGSLLALALALAGCVDTDRSTGSAPRVSPKSAAAQKPRKRTRSAPTASVRFGPPSKPDAAVRAPASVAVPTPAPAPVPAPALFAEDGGLLSQTEAEPSTSSPWFRQQAEKLFRAIAEDDPSIARAFFFPIEAYRVVKAIQDPDRDYTRRLIAHYERDIHDYHRRLGEQAESARFVELSVPEGASRWMKPGSEGNRLGYHRVLRSELRYLDAQGKQQKLEVTSLISWRGEWYLVHLNGFK